MKLGVWLEAATEDCVRVDVFYLYHSTFSFYRHLRVLLCTTRGKEVFVRVWECFH